MPPLRSQGTTGATRHRAGMRQLGQRPPGPIHGVDPQNEQVLPIRPLSRPAFLYGRDTDQLQNLDLERIPRDTDGRIRQTRCGQTTV